MTLKDEIQCHKYQIKISIDLQGILTSNFHILRLSHDLLVTCANKQTMCFLVNLCSSTAHIQYPIHLRFIHNTQTLNSKSSLINIMFHPLAQATEYWS